MTHAGGGRLVRCAPYFPVHDVPASLAHYERVLGFRREYVGGDPPEFAIVGRDGLAIMLRHVSSEHEIRPSETRGGTWDAFFWVRGLDALAHELVAAGAEIAYGPVGRPEYGMREMAVRDPVGYVLGFGEALEEEPSEARGAGG